jgi:hypothetical protein
MIPKILHLIWVGDESKRPNRFIQTWRIHHPDWEVKLWGNAELHARTWINGHHMSEMAKQEWNGVADMMRWEILHDQGGILVDADSACVRSLPLWLLECEAFACWENELVRPGLIAAGYFGTVPGTPFLAALIEGIREKPSVTDQQAWKTVGPLHLTKTWLTQKYANLTILPSHFFIPRHFSGMEYTGSGPIYALQSWASTLGTYETLADPVAPVPQAFLFEPHWATSEWVEVLLSYLDAFTPEDPVALVFLMDPMQTDQIPLADAEQSVLQVVVSTGRETFPTVMLLDQPGSIIEHLRNYPKVSWVPPGEGNIRGLRGPFGIRLAQSRERMSLPAAINPPEA